MKCVEREQSRSGKTRLLAEEASSQLVDGRNRAQTKQARKAPQPEFGVSEMEPASQKKIVESHICFAVPHRSHKLSPWQPRERDAGGLIDPKAFRTEHVKTERGSHDSDEKQNPWPALNLGRETHRGVSKFCIRNRSSARGKFGKRLDTYE